jgi:Rieske Fe-S protein
MQHEDGASAPTRRSVLQGGAAAGMALPLVAACGTSIPSSSATPQARKGAGPLVSTGQVPVGGGKILADTQIVVTQPRAGEFKAFSAVCTHLQCLLTQVADRRIFCPCHGSEFSIVDGSVLRGPATQPLPAVDIDVKRGQVLPG